MEPEHAAKRTDDDYRLLDNIAADVRECDLRLTRVVHHARHQISGPFAIKEIERLGQDMRIKLRPKVSQYPHAYPSHQVRIQKIKRTTYDENERDHRAKQNRVLHILGVSISHHANLIAGRRKSMSTDHLDH